MEKDGERLRSSKYGRQFQAASLAHEKECWPNSVRKRGRA